MKKLLIILILFIVGAASSSYGQTLTLRPNADGDLTNLTRSSGSFNYEMVDEASADDDATYVYNTTSATDLYNIPDHTTETDVIDFILVYIRAKGESGPPPASDADIDIKTGGTIYSANLAIGGGGSWETGSFQWNTNPKTGEVWTWGNIDSLQIGCDVNSASGGEGRITQVYVEVNYTVVAPDPRGIVPIYDNKIIPVYDGKY